MKKIVYAKILVLLSIVGCNGQNNNNNLSKNKEKVTANIKLNSTLSKFFLVSGDNTITDKSSLIFYKLKSFDTSFVVKLQKNNREIFGVYYEVLPSYHRDVEDYFTEDDKVLYFDGYSFKLDTASWNKMVNQAEQLLSSDSSLTNKACFDCASYFLAYDNRVLVDNNQNLKLFELYTLFVKSTFIDKINKLRKPKLIPKNN
jgi:hypothetical protein